jgi:hypothetical protein
MDIRTGRIYELHDSATEEEAGLMLIPPNELSRVKAMTREQRVAWAATLRMHPLGGTENADERRKLRNVLKAKRRARR